MLNYSDEKDKAIRALSLASNLYHNTCFTGKEADFDALADQFVAMRFVLRDNDYDDINNIYYLMAGFALGISYECVPENAAQIAARILGISNLKEIKNLHKLITAASQKPYEGS